MRLGEAGVPWRGPRFTLVVGMLGASLLLLPTFCASPEAPEVVSGPPVGGLTATLQDEVRDLPGGRIAWSTYWELCWEAYPRAEAYELKTLTGEGEASGELRRQGENCFRIKAAAGENKKSEGLKTRDVQLALQQGQLAYRVRAVLGEGRVSEWSKSVPVGKKLGEEYNDCTSFRALNITQPQLATIDSL